MPILKSAKKRLRQTERRTAVNRSKKRAVKEAYKKVMDFVIHKKKDDADKAFVRYQKALDKAAKGGVYKKNKVARLKSRMVARIKSISSK